MALPTDMPHNNLRELRADTLLRELGEDDAKTFRAWLLDDSISAERISSEMTKNGTPISMNPIRLWRRRNVTV
tara:strand:- start:803 stop:1021 length:219 start_codon:yes stop_codon:yes gene_type:complete